MCEPKKLLCYNRYGEFMDKIACGNFLAELRNEKQLTQEKLAEILGVTNKTVSKWERGNSTPNLETLSDLAEFYKVSLYELQQGKRIKNILISRNDLKRVINKNSITKIMILKIIGIILLIAMIIVAIFSTIYTFTNYGQMKLYELKGSDKELYVNGMFIKFDTTYYLSINNVTYDNTKERFLNDKTNKLNYSLTIGPYQTKYREITFDDKTKIKDALSMIRFNINDNLIEKNINHFYINVNYRNDKNEELTKSFKIILNKKFSNTKLIY